MGHYLFATYCYKFLAMKLEVLPCKTGFQEPMLSVGGKIIDVFLQTLDGWVYIDLYMGLLMGLYTWAQYTPTITTCLYYKDRSYTV